LLVIAPAPPRDGTDSYLHSLYPAVKDARTVPARPELAGRRTFRSPQPRSRRKIRVPSPFPDATTFLPAPPAAQGPGPGLGLGEQG